MKYNIKRCDKLLLVLTILFTLFGLVMIYSSSSIVAVMRYNQSSNYYFFRQLLFSILGLILGFFFILNIPTKKYNYFIIPIGIILFSLLFFLLFQGEMNHGAKSWLGIGSFGIQPSEFMKTALIIFNQQNLLKLI